MAAPPTGLLGPDQKKMLAFLSDWWISIGTIASLLLQILLLLTGGTRKWNRACRFIAWSSYSMSDFVAILVLGGLAQNAALSGKIIYAVWAPILLLHLGAPDNISAYATEDSELWLRHGFTVLLQIASAAYIVASCATPWRYALVSFCLLAAGSIKSAERTLALHHASKSAIKESALTIFEFMRLEPFIALKIKAEEEQAQPGIGRRNADAVEFTYLYMLTGEHQWHHKFLHLSNVYNGPEEEEDVPGFEAVKNTPQLVTLHDVLSSQDLKPTHHVVLMCVGFSLFKLYRRRLVSLYMYEWRQIEKTLQFLGSHPIFETVRDLAFVLDVELRFIFDSLYTKAAGTAFTKLGVAFRIVTTIFLVVSGFFLLSPAMKLHEQEKLVKEAQSITILLLATAIAVELYQLSRLALSDWTKVWLACIYIRLQKEICRQTHSYRNGGFKIAMQKWLAAGILEMIRVGDSIARHRYWNNRIGQYAMRGKPHVEKDPIYNCRRGEFGINNMLCDLWQSLILHSGFGKWILQGRPRLFGLLIQPRYEYDPRTLEDFKHFVLSRVVASCKSWSELHKMTLSTDHIELLRKRFSRREDITHAKVFSAALGGTTYTDLENLLVNWHVATCICELLDDHVTQNGSGSANARRQPSLSDGFLPADSSVDDDDDHDHDADNSNSARPSAGLATENLNDSDYVDMPYRHDAVAHGHGSSLGGHNSYRYDDASLRRRRGLDSEENEEDRSVLVQQQQQQDSSVQQQQQETRLGNEAENDRAARAAPISVAEAMVMSKLLSRYMAYLLMHKMELLPCQPDIARKLAMDTQRALVAEEWKRWERGHVSVMVQGVRRDPSAAAVPYRLRPGALAASALMDMREAADRWGLILEIWVEILISAAAANKSAEHLRQLTMGGELLTNVWVLLGHLGAGEK